MSLTMSEMSPADMAAVMGNNNRGFGSGNDEFLWLLLFFAWGGGNFGGFGGGNNGVMDGYILTSDFANIERKIDAVNNGLCDGFYQQAQLVNGLQQNVNNGFMTAELSRANSQSALMAQLYNMQSANQSCCCETQRQIERGFAETNYNLATQECMTRQAITDGTRAILDAMKDDKISSLTAENQTLKYMASQSEQNGLLTSAMAAQTNQIIRTLNPTPIPAYTVPNPNCCQMPNC